MIAAWMLHATLVASILALAALITERAARVLGGATRFIWLGALAVALSLAVGRLLFDARLATPRAMATARATPGATLQNSSSRTGFAMIEESRGNGLLAFDQIAVPPALSALDRPLVALWFVGSTLWAIVLLSSATRLRRQRRGWRQTSIDGVVVHLSENVGPALFGIARYGIVVPSWALGLDTSRQKIILAHEQEHARAHDPVVLLLGALFVLLQPWNPATWLIYRRLRFAVEADCDARVLSHTADVRAYAELLLDVVASTTGSLAPIAALSEGHSILERRISLMTRPPIAHPRLRSAAALAAVGALLLAACQVPRPTVSAPPPPPRDPGPQSASRPPVEPRAIKVAAPDSNRTIVRLTSLGLEHLGSSPTILVFADGQASVGIGTAAPSALTDTLRLSSLPAMTMDVTDGDVHLRLAGLGRMSVGADVTGGLASHFSATAQEIIVLKGGIGVRTRGW